MPVDENIVTWNVTNWITVVAMVLIAFTAIGWAQAFYTRQKAAA